MNLVALSHLIKLWWQGFLSHLNLSTHKHTGCILLSSLCQPVCLLLLALHCAAVDLVSISSKTVCTAFACCSCHCKLKNIFWEHLCILHTDKPFLSLLSEEHHYDMIKYSMLRYDKVQSTCYDTTQHNTLKYIMIRNVSRPYSTVQYDMIWYDLGLYCRIRYGTAQYDTIKQNMLWSIQSRLLWVTMVSGHTDSVKFETLQDNHLQYNTLSVSCKKKT